MIEHITGIHHITAMASDAVANNTFFTQSLGQRRVKKTVNFDAPEVYHLYYADRVGTPGTVMTYFPFPDISRARRGVGEVGHIAYAVPETALAEWARQYRGARRDTLFDEDRLHLTGPDGEAIILVATDNAVGQLWSGTLDPALAPRGFHSASLRVAEAEEMDALLRLMGYVPEGTQGSVTRYRVRGKRASVLDLDLRPDMPRATQGAGSVHHIAFAVPDREAQLTVRKALIAAGYDVTPVIDRSYFWAIYFRTPGGILFEIATDEPGFATDEPLDTLGEALLLPPQHESLRAVLERALPAL